jgi:hypothetical protein
MTLAIMRQHDLWDTMPVMLIRQMNPKYGIIEQYKASDVSKEPNTLPPNFIWSNIDLTNDEECDQVVDFLKQHYVHS